MTENEENIADNIFQKKKELAYLIKDFCIKNNLEVIFSIYDSDNYGGKCRPIEGWIGTDSRAMNAFHFLNDFIFLKIAQRKSIRIQFLKNCVAFLRRLESVVNQPEDKIIKALGFQHAVYDEFSRSFH